MSSKFAPTPEQQAILDAYLRGERLVIEAGAGTGKTSTLRLISEADPNRRGIYFAFGKAIAAEAKESFPSNVQCSTAHSLAYGAMISRGGKLGQIRKQRMNTPKQRGKDVARILGITGSLKVSETLTLRDTQVANLALGMVNRFCHSADDRIKPYHLPFVDGITLDERDALRDEIIGYAMSAWDDLTSQLGHLKFEHDHYLKLWQLSRPKLVADFILFDEAQDADPVISAIVNDQTHTQVIMVGDQCQAIYGWRGAVDAMKEFAGSRFQLTQSFRFGTAVSDEANKWLRLLESSLTLRGFEQLDSKLDYVANPDAVLCRTNAGAINEVILAGQRRQRVALVGGGNTIRFLALAAQDLQAGRKTDHPDLFVFDNWAEVVQYAAEDGAGSDLKVFVKMVDRFGIPAILNAVDSLVEEDRADVVVSTAHKAKGREWNTVRVSDDFREPKEEGATPSREEMMLAYVTVTRAKLVLDRGGLAWVDRLVK